MNVSYSIEGGWENRFGGNESDASVWATRKLRLENIKQKLLYNWELGLHPP